jgi:hypothetical protein
MTARAGLTVGPLFEASMKRCVERAFLFARGTRGRFTELFKTGQTCTVQFISLTSHSLGGPC